MKIYLASDHAGFELKNALAEYLRGEGHEVADLGPETFVQGDDYSDYVLPLGRAVAGEPGSMGIAVGKSGQGEAMAANRTPGARAAVWYGGEREILKLSREHNNANILSLGAGFVSVEDAKNAVSLWLATAFSGEEHHKRRVRKLDETL